MEVSPDGLGRATAMVTLVLNGNSNVASPLVPLAQLGPGRMSGELIATLRAMAWLSARLAETAAGATGETPPVVLQRLSAIMQGELLEQP
jgi:hypothetical protein